MTSKKAKGGGAEYTISQMCERTGYTADTLRFYEKAGLLPGVRRRSGRRVYTDENLRALSLLDCLKKTGMPLAEIAEFMRLTTRGDATVAKRLAMMRRRAAAVKAMMDEIKACADHIAFKVWYYETAAKEGLAALPVADILTLAATGSEYDAFAVISRTDTNDKIGYCSPKVYPVFSILDPELTFTVSKKQTAAGCADAMNHVMEQYFAGDTTLLNDGFCESMLKSLMANARACLANPEDYRARAEMMLACTYGCNGILSLGNAYSGWPCHGMEHALSAYYDITHGEGLAILTPRWMRHILSDKTLPRFVKYGVNVFGIDAALPPREIAEKAIQATHDFFASIGIPMTLRAVGIDESRIDEMAHHVAVNEGLETAWAPLTESDIAAIFRASL